MKSLICISNGLTHYKSQMTLFICSNIFVSMTMTDSTMTCTLPHLTPKSRLHCGKRICCNDVKDMRNKSKSDSWTSSISRREIPIETQACLDVFWNMFLVFPHVVLTIFKDGWGVRRMYQTVFYSKVQGTDKGDPRIRKTLLHPAKHLLITCVSVLSICLKGRHLPLPHVR